MAVMPNLAHILTDAAAEHSDRPAIKLEDLQLPYAMLEQGTRHAAGLLAEVKGPTVMKGYWQRPDATADTLSDDGWLLPKGPTGKILKREIQAPA